MLYRCREEPPDRMLGTSGRYVPVELPASAGEAGDLTEAVIDDAAEDMIIGRSL